MTSTSRVERAGEERPARPFTLLDVFTDVPLTGNALAVVLDADGVEDETMLAFAHETRLAETTFVQTAGDAGADYRNRILSMAGELPFAGHPSIGTAVAVARHRGITGSVRYVQQTGSGLQPIEVTIDPGGLRGSASMLQSPPSFGDELGPGPIMSAIGLTAEDAHPDLPPQVVATGLPHLVVPIGSLEALGRAAPNPDAVDAVLERAGAYGLYVSLCQPEGERARVRMFGRPAQIVEDSATGSAAGPLCAYMHARLGCARVEITQGVEMGRRSVLRAAVVDDGIQVAGDVVVILDGTVRLPRTSHG